MLTRAKIDPMVIKSDFADRLNQALDAKGFPGWSKGRQQAAGKLFGVSAIAARKWLRGDSMPDTKKLPMIASILGVTVEWLLYGDSPPEIAQEVDIAILAKIIEGVENGLQRRNKKLTADKKAQIIAKLYKHYSSTKTEPLPDNVISLLDIMA